MTIAAHRPWTGQEVSEAFAMERELVPLEDIAAHLGRTKAALGGMLYRERNRQPTAERRITLAQTAEAINERRRVVNMLRPLAKELADQHFGGSMRALCRALAEG